MAQLTIRCGASNHDAMEKQSDGSMAGSTYGITSPRLTFGKSEETDTEPTHVGMYFAIPAASQSLFNGPNVRIQSTSKLTFKSTQTDSGDFVGDFKIEDAKSPSVFADTTSNISSRTFLSTIMEGDGTDDFGSWTSATSHDFTAASGGNSVSTLLQALFDKYDDVTAIVIAWIYTSGEGERIAESYDTDVNEAPLLTIDYDYVPARIRTVEHRINL